jgi:monoamine oxidase
VTIFALRPFRELARLGPAPLRGRVALAGDYLVSPTLDGAVISGERAAERILSLPILNSVRSASE